MSYIANVGIVKTKISQIDLIDAITKELSRQGVISVIPRQFNVVIDAANRIISSLELPYKPASPGCGLLAWLESDDKGVSSLTMVKHLLPLTSLPQYAFSHGEDTSPSDADDFKRCLGLLAAEPTLKPYLEKMKEVSPEWKKIVEVWAELEVLFMEEKYTEVSNKLQSINNAD